MRVTLYVDVMFSLFTIFHSRLGPPLLLLLLLLLLLCHRTVAGSVTSST